MRANSWFLGLALGLTATLSHAQTQGNLFIVNGVKINAYQVNSAGLTPTGTITQNVTFRAQSGTAAPKFYQRAVEFSKGTTGASIKNFAKRNAGGLAFTGAMLALGWALDSVTGDIYPTGQQGQPSITCNPSYKVGGNVFGGTRSCTITGAIASWKQSCLAWANNPSWSRSGGQCTISPVFPSTDGGISQSTYSASWNDPWGGGTQSGSNESAFLYTNSPYTQPATTGTPATDLQAGEQIAPLLAPADWKKINTDPVTGAIQNTQPILDVGTQVANDLARELNPQSVNATAPTASTTVTTTPIEATPTDTPPQTQTGGSIDFPEFCNWAGAVCEWLDWTTETGTQPANADYQLQDSITTVTPQVVNYNSGISGGQCPSPRSFAVLGTSLEYSYQPICDLANVARIFVLLFAYLSSIYIIMGVRK